MIHLIVLAAGFSRRFQSNKLLTEVEGRPMYLHVVELLEEIQRIYPTACSLTVVTQYPEIRDTLEARGIKTAWNPNSREGIASSLKAGLQKAQEMVSCLSDLPSKNFYCFFVGDQPFLKKETVLSFLHSYERSGRGIGCLSHEGQPGNPVVFSEQYVKELFALTGDVGGKRVLRQHMEDVFQFEVCLEELQDIDYSS